MCENQSEADKRNAVKRNTVNQKGRKRTAGDKQEISGGRYYCDYSPRYQEAYDIYKKAKNHVQQIKRENKRDREESRKKFKKSVDR